MEGARERDRGGERKIKGDRESWLVSSPDMLKGTIFAVMLLFLRVAELFSGRVVVCTENRSWLHALLNGCC